MQNKRQTNEHGQLHGYCELYLTEDTHIKANFVNGEMRGYCITRGGSFIITCYYAR